MPETFPSVIEAEFEEWLDSYIKEWESELCKQFDCDPDTPKPEKP